MVSAIQTAGSAYLARQTAWPVAVSQLDTGTSSPSAQTDATVSLATTTTSPVTYNAAGTLDTGSTTVNQSTATQTSVATTDTDANAARIIAENSAALDKALADSLAKQQLINTGVIAAELAATAAALALADASKASAADRLETSRQTETARQATASNNARMLNELLSAGINQANAATIVNPGLGTIAKTVGAATLESLTSTLPSGTEEASTATSATPGNIAAASNATASRLNSTTGGASSLVDNSKFGTVVPEVTSAAQNSADTNRVAANLASVAATSTRSPTATAVLSSPAPSFRSTQEVSTALASTTPGTTANVLAASNPTTNSLGSTSEVTNSLTSNHVIDSAVQAVFTVAQNPAYANLVAGNYISVAAASAQSPTVAAPPIMLEEIKPAIAIPAIAALSLLGTQYGRNGNSASGYRLRAASPNIQVRPSR